MADNKKYYWLKLKADFFGQKEIKKLRKIAGGDTYTIIYLKMQLLSLTNGGKLFFEGIEDTFVEELALALDETVDNVEVTVAYLIKRGLLLETNIQDEYVLPETVKCIGKESDSAERVRKHRALKAQEDKKLLQCNAEVTNCNTEIEIEKEKEIEIDTSSEEKPLFDCDSEVWRLTEWLVTCMRNNNPNVKIPKDLTKWHKEMDRMLRLDKRTFIDIYNVITFCQTDSFWKSNILSVPKLREKFDTLYMKANSKGSTYKTLSERNAEVYNSLM